MTMPMTFDQLFGYTIPLSKKKSWKKIGPAEKGKKFLALLKKGKTISRKQAKAWYKMGNPSAWVKHFVDDGEQIVRTYTRKKIRGSSKTVRIVHYSIRKETL